MHDGKSASLLKFQETDITLHRGTLVLCVQHAMELSECRLTGQPLSPPSPASKYPIGSLCASKPRRIIDQRPDAPGSTCTSTVLPFVKFSPNPANQ